MPKIRLQGFIIVPDEELAQLQSELKQHIKLTLEETGCLCFRVTQDTKQKNRFNVFEEFIDQKAFLAHQQRVKHSRWGEVTKNIERHYRIEEY